MAQNTVGYSNPLVFKRNLRPGVIHPLDGMSISHATDFDGATSNKRFIEYFDPFLIYVGPTSEGVAGSYGLTGTVGTATITVTSTNSDGRIVINTGATEDDNFVFNQGNHRPTIGNGDLIIVAYRLSLSDVDDMEAYAGWAAFSADWVAALPAHGVFFAKAETQTSLDFHVRGSGASTTQTFSDVTLTDNAFVELVIRIENGDITPYVYDGTKWHIGTTVLRTDANYPSTSTALFLQLAAETGAAASKSIALDSMYMGYQQEV